MRWRMAIDEQQTDGGDLRGAFFCNFEIYFRCFLFHKRGLCSKILRE